MAPGDYQVALRRNRMVVVLALTILIVMAWAYTAGLALEMPASSAAMPMSMPAPMAWTTTDFVYMLAMWAVMMVAMMLPSATPAIVLFDRVSARRAESQRPYAATAAFVGGYVLAWTAFSVLATLANWGLHAAGALSSMMGHVPSSVGGLLLIAAGIFQWTPLKQACLVHCRTPIGFLVQHWREGSTGATVMGLQHGAYCIGCCWLLMVLLFVLGVMNLAWVAVLTVVVLVEKLTPRGEIVSRGLGVVLMVWGGWLIAIG